MKNNGKILFMVLGFVLGIFTSTFIYLYINFKNQAVPVTTQPHQMQMMSMSSMLTNYSDLEFLNLMIIHHNDALDMADKALRNSSDKFILELSKNIISTQSQEIEKMKAQMEKIVNSKQ